MVLVILPRYRWTFQEAICKRLERKKDISHFTQKSADRLNDIFKNNREGLREMGM